MRETLRQGNMSLLVMDSNTRTVKIWSADEMLMEERLYANIFNLTPIEEEPSQNGDDEDNEDIEHFTGGEATGGTRDGDGLYDSNDKEQSDRFLYEDEYVITQILEEEKPYTINIVLEKRTRSRSLEMWGPLGESSFFLLRTPLEDIRSSAHAANRFTGYVGIILAVVGTFLAFWLSRRITEPIRQLTDISIRMKELDFSGAEHERTVAETGRDHLRPAHGKQRSAARPGPPQPAGGNAAGIPLQCHA